MKLAASQIGWAPEEEGDALALLQRSGFTGLEIAPPRIAGPMPYEEPGRAAEYAAFVRRDFGLSICSMQSIWFGQTGSMFGPERKALAGYTKAAIRFAQAAGAGNLVFGNPKNRVRPSDVPEEEALSFFQELGDYAAAHGTVLALEANPAVYGTNFMNTTPEAFSMACRANSEGCRVNLDFGTLLINEEPVGQLRGHIKEINHVHISEPQLAPIQKHHRHKELAALLRAEGYDGYVSVEMKQQPLTVLAGILEYVAEVFA